MKQHVIIRHGEIGTYGIHYGASIILIHQCMHILSCRTNFNLFPQNCCHTFELPFYTFKGCTIKTISDHDVYVHKYYSALWVATKGVQ